MDTIGYYNELMNSIDNNELIHIKEAKLNFIKEIESIQIDYLMKAWEIIFPKEDYPKQDSIHGINIIVEKLLAEAK